MTTEPAPVIVWFRRDLRLADNPALAAAAATGRPVLPLYVLDDGPGVRPIGGASRWWLDKSLRALGADVGARGGRLILRRGDSEAQLRRLIEETGAEAVHFNALWEPDARERDRDIIHHLGQDGVEVVVSNGGLLHRPGSILSGNGNPYRVFAPFLKALREQMETPAPSPAPARLAGAGVASDALDAWDLHPRRPDWSSGFEGTPGEAGADAALETFTRAGVRSYSIGRDQPGRVGSSRLSPHLHWGEVAPSRVLAAVEEADAPAGEKDKFVSELAWREFSAQLLHHFPQMTDRAFRTEFDRLPWRRDPEGLAAWRRGLTGYPIVDAGMRQLWTTGWMHNRVRMIAASFLVKDLLIDWREGEAWFWDTLVDADLGNNVQNWQWIAGSGADASPFFRIFNPVTQGERFDADGVYVRRWVPELRRVPDRWLHAPWTAPAWVLADAGVRLGREYPEPIVDHAEARRRALAALKTAAAKLD